MRSTWQTGLQPKVLPLPLQIGQYQYATHSREPHATQALHDSASQQLCAALPISDLSAQAPVSPGTLLFQTYMPEITGGFDHIAYDLKRNHLFVSAEEHHSVEMFDLKTAGISRASVGPKRHTRLPSLPKRMNSWCATAETPRGCCLRARLLSTTPASP